MDGRSQACQGRRFLAVPGRKYLVACRVESSKEPLNEQLEQVQCYRFLARSRAAVI